MKKQLTKVGLDVDGLLSDFYLAFCRRMKIPYDTVTNWNVPIIDERFHEVENDREFWRTLPMLNPPEAVDFEVTAYVSAFPEAMFEERLAWLKEHGYPDAPLVHAYDKIPVLKDLGIDLFVDDKLSTVQTCNQEGIKCLKYVPCYMKDSKTKWDITHLNEVKEHLKFSEK